VVAACWFAGDADLVGHHCVLSGELAEPVGAHELLQDGCFRQNERVKHLCRRVLLSRDSSAGSR
jgi:hypothetical protein